MRRRIITLTVALSIAGAVCGGTARAVTLNDTFSTNPYATPKRWCERWHHVHFDSINLLVSGVNGTACPPIDPTGCCSTCPTSGCVTTNVGSHFMITPTNYSGVTRSTEYVVGFQSPLNASLGEHPANYVVAHPNCHAGFQAVIFRESNGTYSLSIIRTSDPDGVHPECNGYMSQASAKTIIPSIVTTTLPRYKLKLTTKPDSELPNGFIIGDASFIDTVTNTTYTAHGSFGRPSWYNNQAKRFGVGGNRASSNGVFPFDNFVGSAQWRTFEWPVFDRLTAA